MSERELTTTPSDEDDLETQTPIVVLSHPEFAAAVRQALRDYARPDRLAGNALLSSRLVVNKDQDQSQTEALRHLVRLSAEDLNMHPRDQRLYRALYRTFFNPAATQGEAADLLGLPSVPTDPTCKPARSESRNCCGSGSCMGPRVQLRP